MRPEDDPGWAGYGETTLVFAGPPSLQVDLARPPDASQRAQLAARGLDGPFGVVTPCNPRGQRMSPQENGALLVRFLAELDAAGKRYVRVDGVSPDRRHVESGVALAWSQADVVAWARKWAQSAIYWWDGEAFWVVGALTAARPWRLGAEP